MEENFSFKFSTEGFQELLTQIKMLNQAFENLGGDTKGLDHLGKELELTNAQLRKNTASIVQNSRNLAQSFANQTLAVTNNINQMQKALRAVEPASRNFLSNLLKNNNFDRYLADLNKLNTGHEFTRAQLQRLAKQAQDFNSAVTHLRRNPNILNAFKSMFGSDAAKHLQSKDFVADLKQINTQLAQMNKLSQEKSLDSVTRQNNKNQQLNSLLRDRLQSLRSEAELNKLSASQLEKQLSVLRLIQTEYTRISAMPRGSERSSALREFRKNYGSDAATSAYQQKINRAVELGERRAAQLLTQTEQRTLDSVTRQNNKNQQLNNLLRDRVQTLRTESELNKLNSTQLEKQLAVLRAIQAEYMRISAMPKGSERSSALREFRKTYGSTAANSAYQHSISRAIDQGEVRAAQLLTQAEQRTLDSVVKQQNVARSLNQSLEQRLAIAQSTTISNNRQATQLETQLKHLREIRNEYARISAMPAGPVKSAEWRNYSTRYGSQAASPAGMAQVTGAINAGENTLLRWKQINGEVRNVMVTSRDLHQVWRGMSAGVNQIWMSWGAFAPMAAGLAASASVFKSLSLGKDFGWQMEQVGVAAEAGSQEVAKLSQQILDMGSQNMVQGPMQIAQALKVLTQAGLSTSDAMKAMPSTLNLALVAGDLSDEDSAKFLAGLRSAFHLDNQDGTLNAKALQESADQAAMAANVSQTSVGKMTEALKQASSEASRFGLSVTDTSTALAILAKYNIEGSAAGTSLRNFLSDLSGRTTKSANALKQLGLSIYDAEGMVKPFSQVVGELQTKLRGLTDEQQQKWLKSIFNERGLKTANILLSQSGDEFTKLHNQIARAGENMGYTTTQAARLGETAQGSFLKMKNSWENAFTSIGLSTQNDFKGLMGSLSDLANNNNVRKFISGLTSGFIKVAGAAVSLTNALSPVAPLLAGIAAAATTLSIVRWVQGLGLVTSAVGMVSTGLKTAATSMQAFTAVQAGAAVSLAGTTGTLAGLRVALSGLFAAMGPVGWAALAVGGFVTYMATSKKAVVDLSSEIKNLDVSLASVKTDVLDQFNTRGIGIKLDQKLGLGYKSDFQAYRLEAESTLQAFEANRQRIDSAVRDSLKQIDAQYGQSTVLRVEQETLLLDRKRTLLQEELTRFDQATQHKNVLEAESAQIRGNLVNDLYSLEINLMDKRTQMALQHMQEMQAEAAKTQGFFSRIFDGERRIALQRLTFTNIDQYQNSLSPEDKRFKLLVAQGMDRGEAHAMTSSTFKESELIERLEKLLTKQGIAEINSQMGVDAQRTAIYLRNLQVGAENLYSISNIRKDLYPGVKDYPKNEQLAIKAIPMLVGLLAQAQTQVAAERKSVLDVRQSKSLRDNPPELNKPSRSANVATYNSDIGNIEKSALADQQKALRDQLQKELAAKGTISDALVQAYLANAKALDNISQQEYARKLRAKQLEAEKFLKSNGSAEDKARAQKTLAAIQQASTKGSELAYQALTAGVERVTSGFGHRHAPKAGASSYHNGIDISMPVGTNIMAPESGQLVRKWSGGAGGTQLQFQGDSGIIYGMAHLSAVLKDVGERIEKGQVLAKSGNTGNTTGPHLHFTTTVNGKKVDPRTVKVPSGNQPLASSLGGETTNHSETAQNTIREMQAQSQRYTFDQQAKLLDQKKVEIALQNQLGTITDRERARQEMLLQVENLRLQQAKALADLKAKNVHEGDVTYQDTLADYQRQIENTQRTFEAAQQAQLNWKVGLKKSYNALVDESINYGTFAQRAFGSVTDSLISAMQNLAVTGKLNFKNMTASILADLAKIAMRMAMLKLINYGMSAWGGMGGGGGGFDSLFARGGAIEGGRTLAYASGGVLHHPTTFAMARGAGLAGEAGPEGIFPLTRMANGDLGVQATGSGGTVINSPVSVEVTVNSEGKADSKVDAESLGKSLGKSIEAAVLKIIVKEQRQGGLLAR